MTRTEIRPPIPEHKRQPQRHQPPCHIPSSTGFTPSLWNGNRKMVPTSCSIGSNRGASITRCTAFRSEEKAITPLARSLKRLQNGSIRVAWLKQRDLRRNPLRRRKPNALPSPTPANLPAASNAPKRPLLGLRYQCWIFLPAQPQRKLRSTELLSATLQRQLKCHRATTFSRLPRKDSFLGNESSKRCRVT